MSVRASVLLIGLCFAAAQILVLPPEGWLTGDQGSKYLQARAFAAHGPLNPGIDVLSRDIDPDYRHQEPKLKNRGGRLVSEFLWMLPLVTAPFLRLLGIHGLYVVPALSAIAIFLAAAALGRRLGDSRGVRTGWIVLLVTPVVFYGLEFWEHAPAAAGVMVAAVLLFPETAGTPSTTGALSPRLRLIGAGAAVAIGALFREEVIAALPALVMARAISVPRDRVKTLLGAACWTAAGAAVVFAAAVPVNLMMYGAPLPMHMTQDAWQVVVTTPYMTVRRDVLANLLLPARWVPGFIIAAAAGFAAALIQAWRVRTHAVRQRDAVSRALLIVVHLAAIVAILGITVASPIWRLLHGLRVEDSYSVTSAAHTWPFALAILYAPWFVIAEARSAARFVLVSGVLLLAATLILIPTDGGSQWSPRFLLAVAPLLAVVAAEGVRRAPGSPTRDVALMVGAIFLGSMAMQVHGLASLRRAKVDTAKLTAWIGQLTEPGDVVLTNVYWVPEVTATLAPTRRMLYSWETSEDVPMLAAAALAGGFRRFSLVTSFTLTGYEAPPTLEVPGASCRFTRGLRIPISFGLVLSQYACEGP